MRARSFAFAACAALLAAGSAAWADAKSDAVISKARQAAAKAKTLQADMELSVPGGVSFKGTARLMKPGYGNVSFSGPQGAQMMISDGENFYQVSPAQNQYQKMPAKGLAERALGLLPGSPLAAFLTPDTIAAGGTHRFAGTKNLGGTTYQIVEVTSKQMPQSQKLYFGPSGLMEGMEATATNEGQKQTLTMWLKKVRVDAPMKAEQFAYTPPADFERPKSPDESLLAVGKAAPDFLLPTPGGGMLALEQTLKDKKAVLINFWFYN